MRDRWRLVTMVADYSVRVVTNADEADFSVVLVDDNGDAVASCAGGGGSCAPGESCLPSSYVAPHDYEPFQLDHTAATLDATVLALTPHAYLKMNDASGLPQDSSGNAHHATAISGATYSQTALTSKANAGIRLTHAITLPPPVAAPDTGIWSASFLAKFHAYDTLVNGNGFPGILNWCGGSPPKYTLSTSFGGSNSGRLSNLFDSNFSNIGHASISPFVLGLEVVHAFVIVSNVVAGVSFSTVYVDGVPWVTGFRDGSGTIGTTWDIGQNSGNNSPFFSAADWTISNFAQYAAALSYANVQALTEAMHDAASFAAAQVFTS
jgi:hypothetical protein